MSEQSSAAEDTATPKTSDLRYGWCMSQDCDAEQPDGSIRRGGCPIQTGSLAPCACTCHRGETEGRGFLAAITSHDQDD